MKNLHLTRFLLVILALTFSLCKPPGQSGKISPVAIALLGGGLGKATTSSSTVPVKYKITAADTNVSIGGNINFTISISGDRTSYALSDLVYFSTNTTISGADSYIGNIFIPANVTTQAYTLQIPCGTPTGLQYIGFSYSGEYYSQLINVTDTGTCNPVVASVGILSPATAVQGNSYTFPVSITSGAQPATYSVYLSTDTTINTNDTFITSVILTTSSQNVTITIPGTVLGNYYVGLYYQSSQTSASTNVLAVTAPPPVVVNVSGTVQYEFVPVNPVSRTLNTSGTYVKPARYVTVHLYDNTSTLVASTVSSNTGAYSFTNKSVNGGSFRIRMISEMKDAGGKYEFHIKDAAPGTTVGLDYAIYSSSQTASSCSSSCTVNLTAMDSNRGNSPFSILDVIRKGVDKIWSASPSTSFPLMHVKWQNGSNNGSYFSQSSSACGTGISNCIVLLGNRSVDSDEFDLGVLAHEFTHYLEATLSRSDSVGGSHYNEDLLEPRIAYSEGLGNAMGSIINDDPVYVDTSAGGGFTLNMENQSHTLAGYYSENSVQSVIWDLYDDTSDTRNGKTDSLNYPFSVIWNAVTSLKTADNIAYLHEFIKAIIAANPADSTKILDVLGMENIASNEASEPSVSAASSFSSSGIPVHVCMGSFSAYAYSPIVQTVSTTSGANAYPATTHSASQWCGAVAQANNKLFGSQFFKVTPSNSGNMTVTVTKTALGGSIEDPDVYITKKGVSVKSCNATGNEVCTTAVTASSVYIIEIRTYSPCMTGSGCSTANSGYNEYSVKIDLP